MIFPKLNYSGLYSYLASIGLEAWADELKQLIQVRLNPEHHGDFARWLEALEAMPSIPVMQTIMDADRITVLPQENLTEQQTAALKQNLLALQPWRKGPFEIHGVYIDTEWRSDWKWQRIRGHLQPLAGRKVLDVGCGNGYHLWRMLGEGAKFVLGVDPSLLFIIQFNCIKHFIGESPAFIIPAKGEELPANLGVFDTVFSMGVLYHRRSPIDHLLELRGSLHKGGQLVLETLVVDGEEGYALVPENRYAQMRNVWFLPSCASLISWLGRCGFSDVELVDVSVTSVEEQRSTEWMCFDSLPQFLDPQDSRKTIEGYPAPTRAVITAIAI